MENNDLCFYIEGDELCLECVLEKYMGVPILFCCKGKEDQRYLALCTDFKEFHYIVAKISLVELHSLMVKQISIRDAFLNQPEYWNIISGEDVFKDKTSKHPVSEMNRKVLPAPDAYLEIFTAGLREFLQKVE